MPQQHDRDRIVPLQLIEASENQDLPAGEFTEWLDQTRNIHRSERGANVPCGDCTACCRSSQFVHIEPDEANTLARVPKEILFPAPGRPQGHVLLGYDSLGRCPLLIDDKCSIYVDRPRACRKYDCRVYVAAGVEPSEDEKRLITERTQRWRFQYATDHSRKQHSAIQAASRFLRENAVRFPGGLPRHPGQLALLAMKVSAVLLKLDEDFKQCGERPPESQIIDAVVKASRD